MVSFDRTRIPGDNVPVNPINDMDLQVKINAKSYYKTLKINNKSTTLQISGRQI